MRDDLTLEKATAMLRGRGLPEQLSAIIVVDRGNVLKGMLPLARLLFGEPGRTVADGGFLLRPASYFSPGIAAVQPSPRLEPASFPTTRKR